VSWIRRLALPISMVVLGLLGIAAGMLIGAAPASATVSVGLNKPAHRVEITDLTGASDVLSVHSDGDNYFILSTQPLTFGQGCPDAGSADGKFRAPAALPQTSGGSSSRWAPGTTTGPTFVPTHWATPFRIRSP